MGIPHFETGPYMKISHNSPQNWFENFFPENHHLENAQNNGFLAFFFQTNHCQTAQVEIAGTEDIGSLFDTWQSAEFPCNFGGET